MYVYLIIYIYHICIHIYIYPLSWMEVNLGPRLMEEREDLPSKHEDSPKAGGFDEKILWRNKRCWADFSAVIPSANEWGYCLYSGCVDHVTLTQIAHIYPMENGYGRNAAFSHHRIVFRQSGPSVLAICAHDFCRAMPLSRAWRVTWRSWSTPNSVRTRPSKTAQQWVLLDVAGCWWMLVDVHHEYDFVQKVPYRESICKVHEYYSYIYHSTRNHCYPHEYYISIINYGYWSHVHQLS